MIAYIDTEVSVPQGVVADYGVVREDGAVLHTPSGREFAAFAGNARHGVDIISSSMI